MASTPITSSALRLIAGCSLALMSAASSSVVFAHGGHHDEHQNVGSERHGNAGHGWSDRGEHHRHQHHHPKRPLHGPGSSHDPVVYHPPVKPISKPVAGAGPAKPAGTTVVRDHRTPPPRPHGPGRVNPHCNKGDITGCTVRDHRTPPPTQCLGDLC
jgi:hypothetical protein